jgi:hypothetical protein
MGWSDAEKVAWNLNNAIRAIPTLEGTPTTTFASMWLLRLKSAVPEYHLDLTVLTETNDEGMFPRPSRRCRYENHRFHFGDGRHFHP